MTPDDEGRDGERAAPVEGSPDAAGGRGSAPAAGARPFVVLGVGGGIAAYKAVDLCRRLVEAGCHVAPVLTEQATRFVGSATFDALASERAHTSLWEDPSPIPHTRLGQRADVVVVAPATAHLLAGYAGGFAGDLLTATLLATRSPVVVCPAMHTEMWEHPAVQHNLSVLRRRGVTIVPPEEGRLAGGDQGAGRLAEPAEIARVVRRVLDAAGPSPRPGDDFAGRCVVVSAGGTREAIDPVRFIGNRSSGKQGHALASAAAERGATVVLVTTSSQPVHPGVDVVRVESAAAMERTVLDQGDRADVVIMAAAVADFRPKSVAPGKLHKDDGLPELVLEPTPDILGELGRRRRDGQVLVGFAAETAGADEGLRERAARKLRGKGVDLMVANDVSRPDVGFEYDTNEVTILADDGSAAKVSLTSKDEVAHAILDRVSERLRRRAPPGHGPGTKRP